MSQLLVRNLEEEGQPIIGRYRRAEEDSIVYTDEKGTERFAPADCVDVVGPTYLSVTEYIEWVGED